MAGKLWFKAKSYGGGWAPSSWEGWLVIGLFIIFEVCIFRRLDLQSHSASDTLRPFFIYTIGALIVLLAICFYKGEKLGWRWGDKK